MAYIERDSFNATIPLMPEIFFLKKFNTGMFDGNRIARVRFCLLNVTDTCSYPRNISGELL